MWDDLVQFHRMQRGWALDELIGLLLLSDEVRISGARGHANLSLSVDGHKGERQVYTSTIRELGLRRTR
mgnify:CR=1 FL=1